MIRLFSVIILSNIFINVFYCFGQQAKNINPAGLEVVNLKLEVDAFEFLRSLGLKKGQLKRLNGLVKDLKVDPLILPVNSPPVFSVKYKEKLEVLRNAYVLNDVNAIDKAKEDVEKVLENEEVEVDYRVPVSDAALVKAKDFYDLLKVYQIAGLVGSCFDEDYEGPVEKMMVAFFEFPKLNDDEKNELSEIIIESVVVSIAGINANKRDDVKEKVAFYLNEVSKIKPPADKAVEEVFREKALKIRGPVSVMAILKNTVDFELAKQLSNPKFATAVSKFKVD